MAETLTESFCERCGTRYEFKAPTRLNPLRKTAAVVGGLKNWVTSQDDMSDAMRDALRQQEEALAAAQLEAFHQSFNFCIDCRQYTCVNCWNDGSGRCRSCAPIPGTDDLAERLAASTGANGSAAVADAPVMGEDELQRRLGLETWPTSDLPTPATNGHSHVAWPEADVAARAEPTFEAEPEPEPFVEPEPEPMVAAEPFVEPEPEPMVAAEPQPIAAEAEPTEPRLEPWLDGEPMVAGTTPEPVLAEAEVEEPPRRLHVVAWEPDAAYEVVAQEPEPVVEPEPEPIAAEIEPEPVLAAEVESEPEPVVEPEPVAAESLPEAEPEPVVEPEPVAAESLPEAEPEPEPIAAAADVEPPAEEPAVEPEPTPIPRIAPIRETILSFPTTPRAHEPAAEPLAAEDDSPEVAARRAQLDLLGLGDPGQGPVEPARPAVLPYRSRGAAPSATALAARATYGSFWEASAREVAGAAANIGVQNCGQCGLSLSANARFCRRCGTRQAQSA